MSNLVNVWAESGADIVGDDAEPALIISNACGPGLAARGLVVTSTASIDMAMFANAILANATVITGTAGTVPLTIGRTAAGNYSTGVLKLGSSSVASGCAIELIGSAYTSIMSIDFAAGTDWATIGGIRVKASDGDTMMWIPLLPEAAIEDAATFG